MFVRPWARPLAAAMNSFRAGFRRSFFANSVANYRACCLGVGSYGASTRPAHPFDGTSKLRLREAENARRNRLEIVKARFHRADHGRDVLKWTSVLAGKHGLRRQRTRTHSTFDTVTCLVERA